jgi:nucleotide-binding universal stress UspA family protein
MFDRILVAFDFGDAAHAALGFASRLVATGGRVHLLFALEPALPLTDDGAPLLDDPGPAILQRLQQLARDLEARGAVTADAVLASGRPWRSILDAARRSGADAIFMGSHGRRGAARLFLGSVAEHVVRESPVPVCVVKAGWPAGSGRLRRIGLATDLGARSRAAASARRLATDHHARLELLHVIDRDDLVLPPALAVGLGSAAADAVQTRRLDRLQRRGARVARTAGVQVAGSVSIGNIPARLATEAHARRLDLLVMGTHGRKGLERLLFGSIAADTVRNASCPVLVVNETLPLPRARRGRTVAPGRAVAGRGGPER